VTQLAFADGAAGKGDLYQLMIMPTWLLTDKLEAVFRYQCGLSSADNGITTLNRQEKTVGKFTGDTYNAAYLGLNYYFYGQKFKLMLGEQYANLGGGTGPNAGYSGWTTLAGFRLYF
jgi:phosphate-selective porin OprO and OprP